MPDPDKDRIEKKARELARRDGSDVFDRDHPYLIIVDVYRRQDYIRAARDLVRRETR